MCNFHSSIGAFPDGAKWTVKNLVLFHYEENSHTEIASRLLKYHGEMPVIAFECTPPFALVTLDACADDKLGEWYAANKAAVDKRVIALAKKAAVVDDKYNADRKPLADKYYADRKALADKYNADRKPLADKYYADRKPLADKYNADRKPLADRRIAQLSRIAGYLAPMD